MKSAMLKLSALLFMTVYAITPRLAAQSIEWSRTYGSSGNENAFDVQQLPGGDYLVGGVSPGGFYVMELAPNGDTVWTRTYSLGAGPYMTREVQGNGILLAGYKMNGGLGQDARFAKLSLTGDLLWSYLYGGYFDQIVNAAAPTSDGGCVAAGQHVTGAFAMTGIMVMRIAANGDSVWMVTFPGSGADNAFDVATTSDDGCIVAGSYGTNNNDAYFIRLDAAGNVVWTKQYGTTTGVEKAYCVIQTPDHGFFAVVVSPNGGMLYKLGVTGDTAWTKPLPFGVYHIREVSGGRYVLAGQYNLNAAIILLDPNGDVIWSRTYGGGKGDLARVAVGTADGGFILAGTATSFGAGGADFFVVNTDSLGQTVWVKDENAGVPEETELRQNYPNPFNPVTNIEYTVGGFRHQASGISDVRLVVYDVLGREVAVLVNERKTPGTYEVTFDGGALASGIYFYRLDVGGFVQTKKLILLK